jgi:hypothetical protein
MRHVPASTRVSETTRRARQHARVIDNAVRRDARAAQIYMSLETTERIAWQIRMVLEGKPRTGDACALHRTTPGAAAFECIQRPLRYIQYRN